MNDLKFLIVGCGRSGTGFFSGLVEAGGMRCGHEEIFNAERIFRSSDLRYESSWYAVPYLDLIPDNVNIVHVIRNPQEVISSFHRIGLLAPSPIHHITRGYHLEFVAKIFRNPGAAKDRIKFVRAHRKFLENHSDVFSLPDELKRLEAYWRQWNQMIDAHLAHSNRKRLIVRIEEIDTRLEEISDFLNLPYIPALEAVDRNPKSYRKRAMAKLVLDMSTVEQSRSYGYDLGPHVTNSY